MKILNSNKDLYNGLFLLTFSIIFLAVTPSQVALYEGTDALSPRLVPYFVLTMIGLFGILLIVKEVRDIRKAKSPMHKDAKAQVNNVEKRSLRDLMIFIGMSIFLVFTAEIIGFTFAAILILITTLKIFYVKKWYMIFLIGILIPIIIDILFRFLKIYLPLGFWESLIY